MNTEKLFIRVKMSYDDDDNKTTKHVIKFANQPFQSDSTQCSHQIFYIFHHYLSYIMICFILFNRKQMLSRMVQIRFSYTEGFHNDHKIMKPNNVESRSTVYRIVPLYDSLDWRSTCLAQNPLYLSPYHPVKELKPSDILRCQGHVESNWSADSDKCLDHLSS